VEHIGSPFMVKVTGDGSGRMMEKILRHHDAADITEVGSECELSLKIPSQSVTKLYAYSLY